jgi:hypothetical protein
MTALKEHGLNMILKRVLGGDYITLTFQLHFTSISYPQKSGLYNFLDVLDKNKTIRHKTNA